MTELLAQTLMLWYRFIDWINADIGHYSNDDHMAIATVTELHDYEDEYENDVAQDYPA